jgi:uncharacterized protein (TIGR03437 family)
MKTKTTLLVLLVAGCAWQCSAQPAFDPGGDGLLNGTYYMRQVSYFISGQGTLDETINIQGNITFSGTGVYTFSGSVLDSAVSSINTQTFTTTGNYVISASGEGYISAIYQTSLNDFIVGLVSHGIFIGSIPATNLYNTLFIAAPVGTEATNGTLKGAYAVAYIDPSFLPSSNALPGGDAFFTMMADGQGNIGNINVTSYTGTSTTATTQSLSGVTYAFTNGAAQLKFSGKASSTTLISGTQLLYISPDGNFIFGGSYNGYDMFAGVRAATSPPSNYQGLYFQAGLDLDESTAGSSSGYALLDSYFGSFEAFSGNIIGHQALSSVSLMNYENLSQLLIFGGSTDFTYYDSYTLNSDGSSDDSAFGQHYMSSADGLIRVGYGIGPYLSLNVAIQAPTFSGSGVYLSPVGVVNAASSAPFTAQVSPGEFLTLYGSGLAPSSASAPSFPLPQTLNGVQVMINEIAAPLNYVSPTQINLVVPYAGSETTAHIQVINNNVKSNVVTELRGLTSTGVFTTNPEGGLGYAAALHSDYSVITESSPAKIGETVSMFLAGMGAVNLPVMDGTAAPSNPTSITTSVPLVYILDTSGKYLQATTGFSGLAPGFAGLYQINFTIPAGLASGNASLEVIGPDSDTFQALLPVTSTTAASTPDASATSGNESPGLSHAIHHRRLAPHQHLVGGNPQ